MNIFLIVLDIILIAVSNFVLINSFFDLKKNKTWILYYVFYFLFIVPIMLDRLYSVPYYETGFRYGYVLMSSDPAVNIIYDVIMIFLNCIFYFFLEYKFKIQEPKENNKFINNRFLKFALFMCAIAPVVMFLLACFVSKRSPTFILDIGWKYKYEKGELGGEIFAYSAIERLTYIAVTCCFLLIFSVNYKKLFQKNEEGKRNNRLLFLTLIMVFVLIVSLGISLLLEGKRSIYLFAGIVFFAILFYKVLGRIKPWLAITLFAAFAVGAFFVVFFLGDMFRSIKAYGDGLNAYKYTSLRVDFFRDQSLKMVIYSMLHSKELPLLSFPFQSYLTEIFYLFPIVYLPIPFKKGYETYLTATYAFVDSSYLDSMRITNSGLDELCANFSIFGVLIYGLLLIWLFKLMTKASDDWNVIIFICFVLFMMYSNSYICWYYEFIIGLIIISFISKHFDKKKGGYTQ